MNFLTKQDKDKCAAETLALLLKQFSKKNPEVANTKEAFFNDIEIYERKHLKEFFRKEVKGEHVYEKIDAPAPGSQDHLRKGIERLLVIVNGRNGEKQTNYFGSVNLPFIYKLLAHGECANIIKYDEDDVCTPWKLRENVIIGTRSLENFLLKIRLIGNNAKRQDFFQVVKPIVKEYFSGTDFAHIQLQGEQAQLRRVAAKIETKIIPEDDILNQLSNILPYCPPKNVLGEGEEAVNKWFEDKINLINTTEELDEQVRGLIDRDIKALKKQYKKYKNKETKLSETIGKAVLTSEDPRSIFTKIYTGLVGLFDKQNTAFKKVNRREENIQEFFISVRQGASQGFTALENLELEHSKNGLSCRWKKIREKGGISFNKQQESEADNPYRNDNYHRAVENYLDKITREAFNDQIKNFVTKILNEATTQLRTGMQVYDRTVTKQVDPRELAPKLWAYIAVVKGGIRANNAFQNDILTKGHGLIKVAGQGKSRGELQQQFAQDIKKLVEPGQALLEDAVRETVVHGVLHLATQYVLSIGGATTEQDEATVAVAVKDPLIRKAQWINRNVKSFYESWEANAVDGLKGVGRRKEEILATEKKVLTAFQVATDKSFQEIEGFKHKISFVERIGNFFYKLGGKFSKLTLAGAGVLTVGGIGLIAFGALTGGIGIAIAGGLALAVGLGYVGYRIYDHFTQASERGHRAVEIEKNYNATKEFLQVRLDKVERQLAELSITEEEVKRLIEGLEKLETSKSLKEASVKLSADEPIVPTPS